MSDELRRSVDIPGSLRFLPAVLGRDDSGG